MSMIKEVGASLWQGGLSNGDEPTAATIPITSDGRLVGQDLRRFVKRAGHYLAQLAREIELKPGEVPVHLIAVGSTEFWNPNRNGDGFREEACRRFHHTFKKFARAYRNHVNHDPARSYGLVKASYYNPEMHRIELIVAYNQTADAAKRNGGLVADRELEKLASDDDLPVSMSCKVSHDCCSVCGNKARNRHEYCTAKTCPGGGLAQNMGTLLKSGHVLHADNPEPCFFDISYVIRPADRTAYATGILPFATSEGDKTASAATWTSVSPTTSSSPGWTLTMPSRWTFTVAPRGREQVQKALEELATKWASSETDLSAQTMRQMHDQRRQRVSDVGHFLEGLERYLPLPAVLPETVRHKRACVIAHTLADHAGIVLPYREWCVLFQRTPSLQKSAADSSWWSNDTATRQATHQWLQAEPDLVLAYSKRPDVVKQLLSVQSWRSPLPTVKQAQVSFATTPASLQAYRDYVADALLLGKCCQLTTRDNCTFANDLTPLATLFQN